MDTIIIVQWKINNNIMRIYLPKKFVLRPFNPDNTLFYVHVRYQQVAMASQYRIVAKRQRAAVAYPTHDQVIFHQNSLKMSYK